MLTCIFHPRIFFYIKSMRYDSGSIRIEFCINGAKHSPLGSGVGLPRRGKTGGVTGIVDKKLVFLFKICQNWPQFKMSTWFRILWSMRNSKKKSRSCMVRSTLLWGLGWGRPEGVKQGGSPALLTKSWFSFSKSVKIWEPRFFQHGSGYFEVWGIRKKFRSCILKSDVGTVGLKF